ncbi:hypothetical protein C8Q80DRAFT_1201419 [Daedaleopsis nitida]|nr:hypothetical protein C8Q80DRAFT_1201419 [Daedaleopsis nitida]
MDTSATDFPPSSSSMPTQAPSIDRTFGAILIGTFVAAGLYGVTLHQASRYFRVYGDDSLVCKAVAFTTVLLETAHTALSFHIWSARTSRSIVLPVRLLSIEFLPP